MRCVGKDIAAIYIVINVSNYVTDVFFLCIYVYIYLVCCVGRVEIQIEI